MGEMTAIDTIKADAPTDPDMYAVVPDKDTPSTWKLRIDDAEHVSMAITAMQSGGFRGSKVELTPEERKQAKSKIHTRIEALKLDKDTKQNLLDRLDALKAEPEAVGETPTIKDIDLGATMTVKSLGGDRIGGYLVLWGDENTKDLTGDWFTPETDLGLDWGIARPGLYHHGLDEKGVKTTLVGVIDTLEKDDTGVWAEAELNKRNRYYARIKDLVAKGALSWSSGTAPQMRWPPKPGRLERWPILEGSLTPTPAEPRGTDVVPIKALKHFVGEQLVYAYKALNIPTDRLGLEQESVGTGQATGHADATATSTSVDLSHGQVKSTEVTEMDQTQVEALIAQGVAAALKAKDDATAAAAKAEADRQAAIKAEVDKQVAEAKAALQGQQGTKHLPVPNPEENRNGGSTKATNVQVVGDRRYLDMSSKDMAYMVQFYGALANQPAIANKPLGMSARRFIQEFASDQDHKLAREISAKAIKEHARGKQSDIALAELPYKSLEAVDANDYQPVAYKANELDNTTIATQGAEWVPTVWSNEVWERVRISNPVIANLVTFAMPANTYVMPVMSTDPTVYYTGEAANATDLAFTGGTLALSAAKTNKVTLTAKKLTTRVALSMEFQEDAVNPMMEEFRNQSVRAQQNAMDDTVLNGDIVTAATTNINLIDGTPAVAPNQPSYLAFDGMRKYAIITNVAQAVNAQGVAPTLQLIRKLRFTLLGPYAVDIPNLTCVVDIATYQKMLALPEFATYLNVGQAGSNLLGTLPGGSTDTVGQAARPIGVIDGVPFYVSAQLALSNSAGKIPAAGGTLGNMVMWHRTRWKVGFRRQLEVDTLTYPAVSDTVIVMTSSRLTLVAFDTASAAVMFNLSVA